MGQTAENQDYVKVKLNNTSKKCHLTIIKPIWLEGAEFILPKRFSFPKTVYTICQSLIPLCLSSLKWTWNKVCLRYCLMIYGLIWTHKLIWTDLQVTVKSRSKNFNLPAYRFDHNFHENRYTALLGRQFELLGLM